MKFRVDWHGDEVKRAVADATESALADVAEFVLEAANRTAPIEEGDLVRSGSTDLGTGDDEGTASIFYDTPYAARLHENPQYTFQHGRRGKWLQLTLVELAERARGTWADRLRKRLK